MASCNLDTVEWSVASKVNAAGICWYGSVAAIPKRTGSLLDFLHRGEIDRQSGQRHSKACIWWGTCLGSAQFLWRGYLSEEGRCMPSN